MLLVRAAFILTLFTALSGVLFAQDKEESESRLARAKADLAALRTDAEKLPEPEKRARGELADPHRSVVAFINRIAEFTDEYNDLPVAARARKLLPDAHRRNGDVAEQILSLMSLAKEERREGHKADLEMQAATLAADWGDFDRALSALSRLDKELSRDSRVAAKKNRRRWQKGRREASVEASRAMSFSSTTKTPWLDPARGPILKYVIRHPMHADVPKLVEKLLPQLTKDCDVDFRRILCEAFTFFHPDHALAAPARSALTQHLAQRGDLEKAYLHAYALYHRDAGDNFKKMADALGKALSRIERRKLELPRNTRRLRELDLARRSTRGIPFGELHDRFKILQGDYPGSPNIADLAWSIAKNGLTEDDPEAIALVRSYLNRDAPLSFRAEAVELMVPRILMNEGDESAISLYASQIPHISPGRKKSALALDYSQLLEKNDEPQKALVLLRSLVDETKDLVALGAIKKRISDLASEYEDEG